MTDHNSQFARRINTVSVGGNNSGNIASGNRDVNQLASTQSNMAADDVAEIMQAVIEAAGTFQMDDRDRAELIRTAESAQHELESPDRDDDEVKSLGARVVRYLGRAVGGVLPIVLTKYLELKLGLGSAE